MVLHAVERRREDIDAIVSATELILRHPDDWRAGDWRESEHAAIRERIEVALDSPRIRLPERTITRHAAVHPEHESDDLVSLAGVDMLLRGADGRVAARCHHCGDLFIPVERLDERYCRRAAPGEPPGGRTCQDLGPQQRYHERLDSLGRLYRREYKRLDNRQRRDLFPREALDAWRGKARELLATAQAEAWDEQRYSAALAEIEPGGG